MQLETVEFRRGDLVAWFLEPENDGDSCRTVVSSVCAASPFLGTVLIGWTCAHCGGRPMQWVRPTEIVWLQRPVLN